MLSWAALLLLIAVFFVTCAIGVVTGGNSLINVPMMFQFGIDPRVAVATNMFGLTFWSIGSVVPFIGKNVVEKRRMPWLLILTLAGSAVGAMLVGIISSETMPVIVSISMIFVAVFSLLNPTAGVHKNEQITARSEFLTYFLTFVVGIYGGLFSGGYSTIMTVVFVSLAGMTFTEAIVNTKFINIFSSLIATIVFAWQGLIDYQLGIILAVTMFIAAYVGAKVVTKMSDLWLRRIFLTSVIILAGKILFSDVLRLF